MDDRLTALIIGSLLHDVGKVIYRSGDGRAHSESGVSFIKEICEDEDLLDCIRYHHGKEIAGIMRKDSLAYITYIADNISAGTDRRESENKEYGFDKETPLGSVFNFLNDNEQNYAYEASTLQFKKGISYPKEKVAPYSEFFYSEILRALKDGLKAVAFNKTYTNSILELMEAYLTYVPSSTSKEEVPDISLYDHSKMTAAAAACIYEYLESQGERDYRSRLFEKGKEFYKEEAFILYSCDMSGIQDFIYTISGEGALKALRARSFYLELLLEHIVDELIDSLGISRTNLIYTGGGHAYLLLPNTSKVKERLEEEEKTINRWFVENFGISLYLATAYAECSGNDLMNMPEGNYGDIYKRLGKKMSENKLTRYDSKTITMLNSTKEIDGLRECKECKRSDLLVEDEICVICDILKSLSVDIARAKYFMITKDKNKKGLPLTKGMWAVPIKEEAPLEEVEDENTVRFYSKNEMYTGQGLATKLWMGDYSSANSFEELAKGGEGINRIGVLRADVDNLGRAFVSGFKHKKFGEKYLTLSRTATLSRQLSLFFKYHINSLLSEGNYKLKGEAGARKAMVVYSGGDDMFIVGAWNECIELAIDINEAFKKYTQGKLSISAGLGIYNHSYPIARIAVETGSLESFAKGADDTKNKIALFEREAIYEWETLVEEVIADKLRMIQNYMSCISGTGMTMLYKLYDLLNSIYKEDEKINIARLAYYLAKMAPKRGGEVEDKFNEFSDKIYSWAIGGGENLRQLITAIGIYAYLERKDDGNV